MSMLNDMAGTLSGKEIRNSMTIEERTDLFLSLLSDLEWDSFSDDDGNDDRVGAMEYLKRREEEVVEIEKRFGSKL